MTELISLYIKWIEALLGIALSEEVEKIFSERQNCGHQSEKCEIYTNIPG